MIKDIFWNGIGIAFAKGAPLITGIILVRLFGAEGYGPIALVLAANATLIQIFSSGYQQAANVLTAKTDNNQKRRKTNRLIENAAWISTTPAALLFIALASPIAHILVKNSELTRSFIIIALTLPFQVQIIVSLGAMAGAGLFNYTAQSQFTIGALSLAGIIFGSILFESLTGTIAAFAIANLLGYILIQKFFYPRDLISPIIKANFYKETRSIFTSFALPSILSAIMVGPVLWFATSLLARQPKGMTEVAIFQVAQTWHFISCFIATSILNVALTYFSRTSKKDLNKLTRRIMIITLTATIAISVMVVITSPWIIRLYGQDFSSLIQPLRTMAAAAIPVAAAGVLGQVLISRGQFWLALLTNTLWMILFTISISITSNRGMNADSLSIAYLISYTLYALLLWPIANIRKQTRNY